MIEARSRIAGFDAIWPLLAELAWMAPQRAQALASRLDLPELDRLLRGFDAELVETRRKLRETHPMLFARYMQDR